MIALIYAFIYSRHGRAVISIRDDEVAAESSGVNVTYYKVLVFAIAAGFAGVAGALWSHAYSITPRVFDFNKSIDILIFVVLGGMGSITGSVIAASALTLLPEMLRGFDDYRMVIYALLLIVMMVFRPGGLLGKYEFSLTRAVKNAPANVGRVKAFSTEKGSGKGALTDAAAGSEGTGNRFWRSSRLDGCGPHDRRGGNRRPDRAQRCG